LPHLIVSLHHITVYLNAGEVSSVLAEREISAIPVLRCRPDGRIQYAAVHTTRVQDHRRPGMSEPHIHLHQTGY